MKVFWKIVRWIRSEIGGAERRGKAQVYVYERREKERERERLAS